MTEIGRQQDRDSKYIQTTSGEKNICQDENRSKHNARVCPNCQLGIMAYDGCLNLTCPVCGFTQSGGGFT